MAKNKKLVTNNINDTSTVSDRFLYYDKLHFIPVEKKDKVWGAQALAFMKRNSVFFIDPRKAEEARKIDRGEIDPTEYKKMIDPVISNGKGGTSGGEALYFHADWKACPIFVHLDNILKAKVKEIPLNLVVTASDQYAMSKKQKENAQIIGQDMMRNFIDEFNQKLGYPKLTKFDDPFKYVQKLQSGYQPPQKKKNNKIQPGMGQEAPTSLLDSIKAGINDNESLALYNENIQKLPEEAACEIGIKYYMLQVNKYQNKARDIISDLKNHNTVALRFYTSETTGRPVLEYKNGANIRTFPFKNQDGSDMKGWYEEEPINFGDFVQQFGAKCTTQQLKAIFEQHRRLNGMDDRITYENCDFNNRRNAKITVGYFEFESQDMEVYANYQYLGNQKFTKKDYTYDPNQYENKPARDERHYNVWYKGYYLPLLLDKVTPNYNIEMQGEYMYEWGKLQDQQREGDDFRYVKSSLVIFKNDKDMTWAEIMNRFMPKINFLWFKFQNEMVNAIPQGGFFAKKLVSLMAKSADEANNNNESSAIEFMKQFKQTGWGLSDPLMDDLGKIIGSGSPFMEFKNSMMLSAFENLDGMMKLYNLMMQALSQNAITEGAGSKPRQNGIGIQATITASDQAIFFITDPYEELTLQAAEKFLYYFKEIVDQGDSTRLDDFLDVVGEAIGAQFESVKDIPYHSLGLSVDNAMTDEQKQLVNGLAEKLASAGILQPEDVFFIASIDNVKLAYAILALKAKAGREALAQQAIQQQQMAMQMDDKKVANQIALINAQQAAQAKSIDQTKQWDYKIDQMINGLKGQIQTAIKQQVGQNKSDEIITKSQVEKINNPPEHESHFGLTTS